MVARSDRDGSRKLNVNRQTLWCVVIIPLIFAAVCFVAMLQLGCQVGVSLEAQTFYPDEAGNGKKLGDPRKDRYAPGNVTNDERFNGLGGGK